MMRTFAYFFASIGVFALLPGAASGQSFEVADVHVSAPATNSVMRGGFYRGGRYEVRTANMVGLISMAFGVDADKVVGGPGWLDNDRFDVIAKAPADATPEALRTMLRTLLAERFRLMVHNDTRPLPAYVLTAGKKPQMKQADGSGDSGCRFQPPPTGVMIGPGSLISYSCRNMTLAAFAEAIRTMISGTLYLNGYRIVDRTELQGIWNFDVKYTLTTMPGPVAGPPGADVVTLFDAVEKQLGLKLELTRVPMPVLTVDSVDEKPTENLPGVGEKLPVAPTEFEVADIKPSDPGAPGFQKGNAFQPGGRVDLQNYTLRSLIGLAWNIPRNLDTMIAGGPKFLDTDHFDIVAKASTGTSLTASPNGSAPAQTVDPDSIRVMMRALLKDRFRLALHNEERPLPGWALVSAKPKLRKADPSNRTGCKEGPGMDGKDPRTPVASRLVTCLNMTLAQYAQQLPLYAAGVLVGAGGGIVDETGLDGAYDMTLNFSLPGGGQSGAGRSGDAGGAPAAADPGVITLFDAVEKQLGLKLEPRKNPATVLVIDHVEEKPTDN